MELEKIPERREIYETKTYRNHCKRYIGMLFWSRLLSVKSEATARRGCDRCKSRRIRLAGRD